jgi:16S rRNA G966 N2-methylase RsmD
VLHDRAESVEVEKVPEGAVVYLDPPYQATTDYASDLPREAVLDLAQRWHAAGATVAISEQVPLPIDGWHHLRIDQYRVGQKRIFSRQQEEWITMSRPPVPPALWMQRRTDPGQMGLWEERT